MAIRIPWDKYEAVILLDACIKVKQGFLSKRDAVLSVSNELRHRAETKGLIIDEIFRNENGISMQFTIIDGLLNQKKCGLHTASLIFLDVVNLYREDKNIFYKLLQEAREMGVDLSKSKNNFKTWIMDSVGEIYAKKIIYSITSMSILFIKAKWITEPILRIDSEDEINEMLNAVRGNRKVKIHSKKQLKQFINALEWYMKYIQSSVDGAVVLKQQDDTIEMYRVVLNRNYKKGFRIMSNLEMKRFRQFWLAEHGKELLENDEVIREKIEQITLKYQDFVYSPENMLDDDTKMQMYDYIVASFNEGKKAIYYDALYKEFKMQFEGQKINNPDMLKTYLEYTNNGRYFVNKNYISADKNIEIDPTEEVRNYLISYGEPIQTEELVGSLAHISRDKVITALAGHNSYEFVRNQKGEYFHVDIIDFTDSEMDSIKSFIQNSISEKKYIGGMELIDMIEVKLPNIKERYPFLSWLGLRDIIAYKLRDVFSFKGKIISANGEELSMKDVFADFAKSHDTFTLAQLNSLKNDLDTTIYFDSIYKNALRISENDFVSKDRAIFDVEATDIAINRFCIGDYLPIKEVKYFGTFPYACFPWNGFLLEHYVADYSKEFKLIHSGFTAGTPAGAIVRRRARIESFEELIERALAESSIQLVRNEILEFLCDAGYLARRSYSNIDQAINKAKMLRSQKGN